ncbi:MAG: hypothetical protein KJ728_14950 [Alphaproteobacteria bacterium]|uniref:hypothetical protein n=1 Tax=Brevundimonas sp. TaxID=1871086 RepID=UPI001DB37949|nr:hypothetical protein [Alphaproteobacteria bacterium]MBU1522712.1 hypothetical protein [Alphaproteobacteria bacterium]MBU2029988.1 hypothetical protein [Alphaproteobacteria bacterium]MBU2164273.1 hypothetical protein [Alphaproteobacteria bacterium]MBU2230905.1 hypothetical protein [Alphaproteobacteria bacterium]
MSNDKDAEIRELRERLARLEESRASGASPSPQLVESTIKPKNGCVNVAVTLLALFGLLIVIATCSGNGSSTSSNSSPETTTQQRIAAEVANQPAVPTTAWSYRDSVDPMTDKKTFFACVTSSNDVRLNPPYSDVKAELCIRQSPRYGLDAFVQLNGDGQIICRSYDNCTVKVRFGDGTLQSFSSTDAADGSSNIVFISNASRFLTGVKTADVTRIQMTLYEAGDQAIEFNTKDLEWPRPAS